MKDQDYLHGGKLANLTWSSLMELSSWLSAERLLALSWKLLVVSR